MTAEQLQNARASAWRQSGNALLTAEDAAEWLREAGLALYLPRPGQIAAPAGSFAEAVLGAASTAPPRSALVEAASLLHRLLADGAVALNLLGLPGDQPDYLATEETLPFLFALRGDREWKRGPRGKSSPLVVEVWKLLEREGAMNVDEIKHAMGRELTEVAAARALTELWNTLRIEPVYAEGAPTKWQTLEVRHGAAMAAAGSMAQGTALSALISLYLQSVIAATGEEIEAFLSPLASRSRVRDAVHGLTATRQVGVRNLGAHEHLFVQGSMPEFPEAQAAAIVAEAAVSDMLPETPSAPGLVVEEIPDEPEIGEGRRRFVAAREASKKPAAGPARDRGSFAPRPARDASRTSAPSRTPGKPFHAREPWKEDRRPPSEDRQRPAAGEKPRPPRREGEDRRPFRPQTAAPGERRPFSGEKRSFPPGRGKETGRPQAGRDRGNPPERRAPGDGASFRKPFSGGSRSEGRTESPSQGWREKPSGPPTARAGRPGNFGGARPPRRAPEDRPPSRGEQGATERRSFRPSGDRPARPFRPAGAAGARPPAKTGGSDRGGFAGKPRPFAPRRDEGQGSPGPGKRPFEARSNGGDERPGRPARSFGASTDRGERKPFPRAGSSYPAKPRGEKGNEDRPRAGGGFTPRPAARRSFSERPVSAPRPFRPRPEESDGSPRRSGSPAGPRPERFSPDASPRPSRPAAPSQPRPGSKRPRTAKFTSTGKPRSGAVASGRPGPRAGRPPGKPGRPGGVRKPAGPRKGGPPRKGPRRDG